ncbi:oligosaccharide flippase family protein [Chryseobacterium sp. L7]|uniref:Oligosaccharide flippase family protein n=1 Tax=Chryseobacterium endalhagicum TaxID=2797638 RepID=A0ABS1QB57_9FLAO|nr:oligosaccharide flippase family protein [Chryseobacterium endalhagicum]MBL1219831.1 oligosaccharide flippase family protein [Chryseobacterium endalhagicum]
MAKNIILLLFRRSLGALISILATTTIIKNLSVEDYGIYSIFLNIVSLASTFTTLGIDAATGYVLQNKKYKREDALVNTFSLGAIISVISFFIFYGIFYNLHMSDFNIIPQDIKMFMVVSSVCMLYANILYSILIGNMSFKSYSFFTIIPNVSLLIALFITTRFFHLSLKETAFYFMMGYILTVVSLSIYLILKYKILKNLYSFKKEISLYILRYGFMSYLSNVITFLNYRVNIFIIGYYLGSKDVGFYSTCLVVIDFIWLIPSTMASITYPMFSDPNRRDLRKQLIPVITRSILLLTTLAFCGFYLLGDFFIPLLFGKEFLVIKSILLILAPGIILFGAGKIITADFISQGKPKVNIYLNGLALLITVVVNFVLIPHFGLKGAAMASSISFSCVFISSLIIYCKMTHTRILDYIVPNISDFKMILKARN